MPYEITIRLEPQERKINQRKHGVSFEEARTVFLDDEALLIPDPDHSPAEERFVLLGMSHKARGLLICHCYRENDQVIRILSARKADKQETSEYFSKKGQYAQTLRFFKGD